jgi:hypothetical protein
VSIHLRRLFTRARRSLLILGVIALAIATVAVYAAAVSFFANSRAGDSGTSAQDGDVSAISDVQPPPPPTFPDADYRQSRYPRPTGEPLIGVNYTHYAFPDCTFRGTYIIASYHKPGVAERVHEQLMQMRQAGIATIRTVLWHQTNGQQWGPIPTAGGQFHEPFRSNLIRFVTEVRKFGFARFTLAFEPRGTHNPLRRAYKPARFGENWRLIRAVRSLVKRHGPRNTRFDLFSEGAPNEEPTRYEPRPQQTARYLRTLYRLYVSRFGNQDVSVSAIGSTDPPRPTNRLENLIRILRSSGKPLPRWYDVHIGYDAAGASNALRQAKVVLNRNRQHQPLVIGDLGYDNPAIARAIKRSLKRSSRRLEEVSPWYTRERLGCQVTPPYEPGAYGRELNAR